MNQRLETEEWFEVNFDGLIGPSHNFSGLSLGNIASRINSDLISNPQRAALQGLEKMRLVWELGIKQAVLPPHERPYLRVLREMGYRGRDQDLIDQVSQKAPRLLQAIFSSSFMWSANAGTVTPSPDSRDGKLHITPANLSCFFHRSIEADFTAQIFQKIFRDPGSFVHHFGLANLRAFHDEGAANHTRLSSGYGERGINIFCYGRSLFRESKKNPIRYPARQTLEASELVGQRHSLNPADLFFIQQNPGAIDKGVFHNDVVCVGNQDVLLIHERAWVNQRKILSHLKSRFQYLYHRPLIIIEVKEKELSLEDAVNTYLFNSQLLTLSNGKMCLVAEVESKENKNASKIIKKILAGNNPIVETKFVSLRESMKNGGGPACLRLRMVLNDRELETIHRGILFNQKLYEKLKIWIKRHYRDRLSFKDLRDPNLIIEAQEALDELSKVLKLGSIYDFQN